MAELLHHLDEGNDMTHRLNTTHEAPEVGLRVFTNDWVWGTITKVSDEGQCGTYCEAWHEVRLDSGASRSYNCDRLTTREPKGI